jgi:hypothetical protein
VLPDAGSRLTQIGAMKKPKSLDRCQNFLAARVGVFLAWFW